MEIIKPNSSIQLPPGFRFHPSDEELIIHYLRNKASSNPIPASVIADIDLYKFNPWELPMKALFGEEDEWYFFTPRDRKYPNGARPNRSAGSGYWKATGTDKPILTSSGSKRVGVKKALVFYKGRPPKGVKTDWIMHEFRLTDTMICTSKRKGSMRLDDWVLCRVQKKSSNTRNNWEDQNGPSNIEPFPYFSNTDDSIANTNLNIEMMRNYQYKDCPLLPYIFASRDLPCTETASSMSFNEGSSNGNTPTSAYNNIPDKNLQYSVSSFDGMFNQQKRKRIDQFQSNKILPSYNIRANEKEEEVTEMNFSGTNQSEGNSPTETSSFLADQWNPIMYQELNQLTFTECE